MRIPAYYRIPLWYFVFSCLWIYFSDRALDALFHEGPVKTSISMVKGWAFVALTSLFLGLLIRNAVQAELKKEQEKQRFLTANIVAMNHITRNFINQMSIIRAYAENSAEFDKDILRLYDSIVSDVQREIEQVSNIEHLTDESLMRCLTDGSPEVAAPPS